jgi:hypothetical protein
MGVMVTMRSLVLLLLLATLPLSAIPSQKDALSLAKREAQVVYTAAQRAKDKAQFIAAAEGFRAVGQKVMEANQALIRKIESGGGRKVERDHMKPLTSSVESLSNFVPPTELSPESIRMVDRYIREIDLAIEAHHAACLNIR